MNKIKNECMIGIFALVYSIDVRTVQYYCYRNQQCWNEGSTSYKYEVPYARIIIIILDCFSKTTNPAFHALFPTVLTFSLC